MVASYTELLGRRYRGKLDEKADKYIHYAVDGANRMQQLVDDLLAYSRVGTQGKPLQRIDSGAVARNVLRRLHSQIREANAEIVVSEMPCIDADELQFGQLLQNLVGNALKFRSERPVKIQIGAEKSEGRWLFSVTDNGIGIEKKYEDRIFQMFQRLHERGKFDGSGIGLAIVKKIVERHEGRVWFDSEPGAGASFHFTMPLCNDQKS